MIKAPKLELVADPDDLMTWQEFMDAVEGGFFIDYDGYGELATADSVSDVRVYPSEAGHPSYRRPEWATHVCWYNR